MAEALGIVSASLGLLPILVEVIRGYRALIKIVSSLKSCTKDLGTVSFDLEIQECIFLNECEMLLRSTSQSHQETREMIDDPLSGLWQDRSLASSLAHRLSKNYSLCTRIIKGMQEAQQDLREQLAPFDEIRAERRDDESLRAAYKRLHKKMSFGFNKRDLQEKVKQLRNKNKDLEALCSQTERLFRHNEGPSPQKSVVINPLPFSIKNAREISSEAYAALRNTFSCKALAHEAHWATLCVDTTVGELLELTLSYVTADVSVQCEKTVRLRLRSDEQSLETPMRGLHVTETTKSRRTRFSDGDGGDNTVEIETGPETFNLSSIEDTCHYLEQNCRHVQSQLGCTRYLGYLGISQSRHIFYVSPSMPVPPDQPMDNPFRKTATLRDLFQSTKDEPVSLKYQLTWALKLTLAVLQFHSTPWLNDAWKTSDLFLSGLVTSTKTSPSLLLRTDLPVNASRLDTIITDTFDTVDTSSLEEFYGINNQVLWALGTALVEIAHWKSIDQLQSDENPNEIEILTIRRMAKRKTFLGGGFEEIVRMCLQCNFGAGNDLRRPDLQAAVYNKVVCPLQDTIQQLERFGL